MYKLILKDKTEINVDITEDTEKYMVIVLDTDMSHDIAISKFTNDNLSYVQALFNSAVLNTYVNIKEVAESSVKDGTITIKLNKSDTKEIVIELRKENEGLIKAKDALIIANAELEQRVKLTEDCILEMSETIYATEDTTEGDEENGSTIVGE